MGACTRKPEIEASVLLEPPGQLVGLFLWRSVKAAPFGRCSHRIDGLESVSSVLAVFLHCHFWEIPKLRYFAFSL
jgi:hypothetical protein